MHLKLFFIVALLLSVELVRSAAPLKTATYFVSNAEHTNNVYDDADVAAAEVPRLALTPTPAPFVGPCLKATLNYQWSQQQPPTFSQQQLIFYHNGTVVSLGTKGTWYIGCAGAAPGTAPISLVLAFETRFLYNGFVNTSSGQVTGTMTSPGFCSPSNWGRFMIDAIPQPGIC